jgi:hypothetical protein
MKILRIISSIIAALLVLAVLVWLLWQNLVPSGVFVAHWRPDKPSALIGPIVPESRLLPLAIADDGTPYRSMVDEPVNFDVRLPSGFETAKVTAVVNAEAKIVEIGGLASRETWVNDLRTGWNAVLDKLDWPIIRENGLALYERVPKFKTISAFLSGMPASGVAAYRADASALVKIPYYVPRKTEREYKTAFRGAASIKAYLQDEPLDFRFRVQEVNRHVGADGFAAAATLNGTRIARAIYADDGNDSADGKLSRLVELRLYTAKPISGIVRIDLPAGDDAVFRSTVTSQQKFVFMNRFYAADNVGYLKDPAAFSLVTNGRRLYATTAHPEAFQMLAVGSGKLTVDDVNKAFSISTSDAVRQSGIASIVSPYGDVRLETAGAFAFGKEEFFNSDPQTLTWESDLDKDGIDYVLTSYQPPPKNGEWRKISATFDLSKLSVVSRAANFTISAPGLALQQKELCVASIDVELKRPPLAWKDVWPNIVKMWKLATGQQKEFVNSLKN